MNSFPRWLASIIGLAMLALVAGSISFYRAQEAQLHQQVANELTAIAQLKGEQIADWRADRLREGAEVMARPLLEERIERWLADPQPADRAALLSEFAAMQTFDGYADVLLLDANGQLRLSLSGVASALHAEAMEAFTETLRTGAPMLTELHSGGAQESPHISVVAPIKAGADPDARPIGALVLVNDAAHFLFPLIQSWPTATDSAETVLFRRAGDDVLYLNNLRHRPDTALTLRLPITQTDLPAAMAIAGGAGVMEGKDYRGVDVLAIAEMIPDSSWGMVAKIDASEAFAAWRTRATLIILLVVLLLALIGVAGLLAWQRRQKGYFQALYAAEACQRASEMRYRITLNSIGDGVIATDAAGRVVMLNPLATALTGWTEADAQGRPLEEVFHLVAEETYAPAANPVARVLAEDDGAHLANHTLLIARNGVERAVDHAAAPIRDDAGAMTGVVLVFRDQTQERAAQRALATSEARNQAMIDAMPDLLFRISRDFRFLDCQTGDPSRLLLPRESFIGRTLRETLPPAVAALGERAITQALASGAMQIIEYDLEGAGGRQSFEQRITPLSDDEVFALTRDITQQRRAELFVQVRMHLLEFAATHTLAELLQESLDQIGALVDSPVAFFHFVQPDQRTLVLQAWSTRTLREYCTMEGKGLHYSIDQAGVWADAMRERKPIVHNDYAALDGRRGLPAGHPHLVRELVAPILRQDQVVALLGVGNKPTDYGAEDAAVVARLADIAWEIAERKRAQETFAKTEKLYRMAITGAGGVVYQRSYGDEQFLFLGEDFAALTGYAPAEMSGALFSSRLRTVEPYGEFSHLSHPERQRLAREGLLIDWRADYLFERKDGALVWLADHAVPVDDGLGRVIGALGILMDITARKAADAESERLRARLLQAEKLETIGQLAGGVAHDFNNMLAVILMRAEMGLQLVAPDTSLYRHLEEIQKSAQRSAELTRQLLGFARKQMIAPRVIDLNEIVAEIYGMLQRLIGEEVTLTWKAGAGLWPVKMDPVQVNQILSNLCVNARDAIIGAGQISIELENVVLGQNISASHPEVIPGDYVMLAVSDEGVGMSKEVLDHIFEPFFTTKQVGRGTGLGLATVYGIVQQNHGYVMVYSEPDIGTTFKLYLPRSVEDTDATESPLVDELDYSGGETVLFAEDEAAVLAMGVEVLERLGYKVLAASTPALALRIATEHPDPIDLLVTDVIMPEMNGRELAERVTVLRPAIKQLYLSGYPADFIARRGILEADVHFLQKPFTLQGMASKVRAALDHAPGDV